jgi:hypothetical protein
MRYKKKEELAIHHAPLDIAYVPSEYELGPYLIEPNIVEVTSLGDRVKRYTCAADRKLVDSPTLSDPIRNREIKRVKCDDEQELSIDRILKTISAVKGQLTACIYSSTEHPHPHIASITCNMTPEVKQHIITASKKLKLYGKNIPIMPCFDKWGYQLPDKLQIDGDNGITITLVDPEKCGKIYFFELIAEVFYYNYDYDNLPFYRFRK